MKTEKEITEKIEKLTETLLLLQEIDKDSEALGLLGNIILYLKWSLGTLNELEGHAFNIIDYTLSELHKTLKK